MKSVLVLSAFIYCFVFNGIAQNAPAIEWQKTLGGSQDDQAYSVLVMSDSNFVVIGATTSNDGDVSGNHGNWDWWVVKVNMYGDIVWQKTYGGTNNEFAYSIQETQNKGFAIAGSSRSNDGDVSGNQGLSDYWIVRLDSVGNILWQNSFGGSGEERANSIDQTTDGGFIITGTTNSDDGDVTGYMGNHDFWVIKLDSLGNLIWQRTLGGSAYDYSTSIEETTDGGFVVVGETGSNDGDVSGNHGGARDLWVVKLDGLGGVLWQNAIGGSGWDHGANVHENIGGSIIITGGSDSNDGDLNSNFGLWDSWVIKLDPTGALVWSKSFGGSRNESASSIVGTEDGGFVFCSSTSSNDGDVSGHHGILYNDIWLSKVDESGTLLWQRTLGGSYSDYSLSFALTENGIVLGGYTNSNDGDVWGFQGSWNDFWMVKLTNKFAQMNGSIFTDLNANNTQDPAELAFVNHKITNQNNGYPSFTNVLGLFSVAVIDTGETVIIADPIQYFNSQPQIHSAFFDTLGQQVDSLNDFAMQPSGIFNDLEIILTPLGAYRPGFTAHYSISYRNIGTTILDPEVIFFPDADLTFDSSSTTPATMSTDSIIWQFPALVPLEEGHITVYLTVSLSSVLGDSLYSSVRIDPIFGDANTSNNWSAWAVPITGSFDPNDILVDRKMITSAELIPTPPDLEYIIRFQNTGTDTAFTVRIENSVPQNADLSTFQFVSSSHTVEIEYLQHVNRFVYRFENILLPDSNTNEAASHGYFRYKIKPLSTLMIGDSVLNTAGIFFDNNYPVITNTAVTVIDNTTGVSEGIEDGFSVSPNPTTGLVYIQLSVANSGTLTLTDITGREVMREAFEGTHRTLDLSDQPSGVYILQLETGTESFLKKIVVE